MSSQTRFLEKSGGRMAYDDTGGDGPLVIAEPGRYKALKEQAKDIHAESGSRLQKVTQPSLIIMGDADPDFPDPKTEASELAKLMRADVLLVENSGYYPQTDNPDKVASASFNLVKRVQKGKD
jgi:pimeloyl-ACP methyl ester carboxylesterase